MMKNMAAVISTLTCSFLYMNNAYSLEPVPTLKDIGPPNLENCVAYAVNDVMSAVGECNGGSGSTVKSAWINYKPRKISILPPLVPGSSCTALRVNEKNEVYGKCAGSNGQEQYVIWNGVTNNAPPVALKPMGQDQSMIITAVGDDFLVGQSFTGPNQQGQSMVTLWSFSSGGAQPMTGVRDNCVATSMKESLTDYNWISLNCPSPTGNTDVKVATKVAGSSTYAVTPLQIPAKSSYCQLGNTTERGQTLGTCGYPDGIPRAAYWPSLTATPTTPNNITGQSVAARMNDGSGLIVFQDSNNNRKDALWIFSQNQVVTIAPPPQATIVSTVALAENGVVLLDILDAQNRAQGAFLSQSFKTIGIGFLKGGRASRLEGINPKGTYAVGSATGADGKQYAIGFSTSEADLTTTSGQVWVPPAVAP